MIFTAHNSARGWDQDSFENSRVESGRVGRYRKFHGSGWGGSGQGIDVGHRRLKMKKIRRQKKNSATHGANALECLNVEDVSIRSRNGAPSRRDPWSMVK